MSTMPPSLSPLLHSLLLLCFSLLLPHHVFYSFLLLLRPSPSSYLATPNTTNTEGIMLLSIPTCVLSSVTTILSCFSPRIRYIFLALFFGIYPFCPVKAWLIMFRQMQKTYAFIPTAGECHCRALRDTGPLYAHTSNTPLNSLARSRSPSIQGKGSTCMSTFISPAAFSPSGCRPRGR